MDNEQIDIAELVEMGRRRRQGDVEAINYFEKIHQAHIEYKRKHKISGLVEMNKVLMRSLTKPPSEPSKIPTPATSVGPKNKNRK